MAQAQKNPKECLIAIVDDHVYTTTAISNFLESSGFRTVFAYKGEDALTICKEKKPDILIIDIVMQGTSGADVAKALPNQKIIFITSHEERGDKVKDFKNCAGVILKPIDYTELEKLVRTTLNIAQKVQF